MFERVHFAYFSFKRKKQTFSTEMKFSHACKEKEKFLLNEVMSSRARGRLFFSQRMPTFID